MIGKTMDDYDKRIVREAMLKAQSEWLDEADNADSFTMIAVAKVIAEAFGKQAELYKTKESGYDDGVAKGVGNAWADEHGVAREVSPTDEAGGAASGSA